MESIILKAENYKHNALEHVDLESLAHATIHINNEDNLFLFKKINNNYNLFWASNSDELFFKGLKETIEHLRKIEKEALNIYIEFIHESFVNNMKAMNFRIVSEFVDYWNYDLYKSQRESKGIVKIRSLENYEYSIAGEITRSCAGASRGIHGEKDEWVKEWMESNNAPTFVAEIEETAVGVCFLNLYGFESKGGTVLWIRELMVCPEFHSRGIGRELLMHSLKWGIDNNIKRSFLACDVENSKGYKLYESIGYTRDQDRGQINMELNLGI